MDLTHFRLVDLFTVANLFILLGLWRKFSIFTYQHKLMWEDFAIRKHINPKVNGHAIGGD